MNKSYFIQANFILKILPLLNNYPDFALKGGTAINFFYRNLPRLSTIGMVHLYHVKRDINIKKGDIEKGFNLNRCYNLMEKFSKVRNEICKDCWAIRFCGKCYIGAEKDGKLDIDKKLEQCKRIKNSYSLYLKRYVEIMEENPKAFERLREWAESQKNFYPTL